MAILKQCSSRTNNRRYHKYETTLGEKIRGLIILSIIAAPLVIALYVGELGTLLFEPVLGVASTYLTLLRLPSAVSSVYVNVLDPALVGAVSGLAIGWIRRGLALRSYKGDSLVSATVSSVLHINKFSLSQYLVHAIGGFAVGVCFSSGGVFLPSEVVRDAEPAGLFPMGTLILNSGSGPGGAGADIWLWLSPFPALLIAAVIIAVVVMLLVDGSVVWLIFKFSVRGGISESVKHVVTAFVDEWDIYPSKVWMSRQSLRNGAVQGMVTGGIVGAILLVLRPYLM